MCYKSVCFFLHFPCPTPPSTLILNSSRWLVLLYVLVNVNWKTGQLNFQKNNISELYTIVMARNPQQFPRKTIGTENETRIIWSQFTTFYYMYCRYARAWFGSAISARPHIHTGCTSKWTAQIPGQLQFIFTAAAVSQDLPSSINEAHGPMNDAAALFSGLCSEIRLKTLDEITVAGHIPENVSAAAAAWTNSTRTT